MTQKSVGEIYKLLLLTSFFCIAIRVVLGMTPNGEYTQGLTKYLEDESKLYQVMFIIDDHLNSSWKANDLVKDVSKHFPSLSISFTKRFHLTKMFPRLAQLPRRTTLFILILDGNQNNIWAGHVFPVLKQLKHLSQRHSYPKCLINLFHQKQPHSFRRILEYLWYQDFLDIALLEHFEKSKKSFVGENDSLPLRHELNPFAKIYAVGEVKAQTKWFPNKLLNLHGHQMKVLLQTFGNPLVKKSYNKFLMLFADSMHCSIKIVEKQSGSVESLTNILKREKAELILNPLNRMISVDGTNNPEIRILEFTDVKGVIPRKSKLSTLLISQEFVGMVIATILGIAGIRITALILKFSRSSWQTFNISQIVIGMSGKEPTKVTERIVFGALVLGCIVYSGYLYSVILDITFFAEPEISTLEELSQSSLVPALDLATKESLLDSSIPHIRKFGAESIYFPGRGSPFDCLTYMADFKNITCIIANAEQLVNIVTTKHKEINAKILQEPLTNFVITWVGRNGSPYLHRLNEIILEAFDFGLLTKLLYGKKTSSKRFSPPEEIEKEKLLLIFGFVLAIGYTFATIAFIAELVRNINWRKVNLFCVSCLNYVRGKLN